MRGRTTVERGTCRSPAVALDCPSLQRPLAGPVERDTGAGRLDLRDRRELYNGFGDTLARAVELVAVPAVFGLIGHALDGRLGTAPWLAVGLIAFALAGTVVRMYYAYEMAMREHEANAPWARRPAPPTPASPTPTPAPPTPAPIPPIPAPAPQHGLASEIPQP